MSNQNNKLKSRILNLVTTSVEPHCDVFWHTVDMDLKRSIFLNLWEMYRLQGEVFHVIKGNLCEEVE